MRHLSTGVKGLFAKMRCPSCHTKCSSDAASCSTCGVALPQKCTAGMKPVSRVAYWICRSGKETLAVLCLCLLVFIGASVTLTNVADIYEPATAAIGLDAFSLHTTDDKEALTDQETALLKEKAAQARSVATQHAVCAVLGLLLFSASLLVLVRIFFVSNRLRSVLSQPIGKEDVNVNSSGKELEQVNFQTSAAGDENNTPLNTTPKKG